MHGGTNGRTSRRSHTAPSKCDRCRESPPRGIFPLCSPQTPSPKTESHRSSLHYRTSPLISIAPPHTAHRPYPHSSANSPAPIATSKYSPQPAAPHPPQTTHHLPPNRSPPASPPSPPRPTTHN